MQAMIDLDLRADVRGASKAFASGISAVVTKESILYFMRGEAGVSLTVCRIQV